MRRAARRARKAGRMLALGLRLAQLGRGLGRLKIVCVTVLLGARLIVGSPGKRQFTIEVRIGATRCPIVVGDYGELEVMRDIILDEEYAFDSVVEPRLILDVGANVGIASLYFRARYPNAEIVAVEPDPETFAKLAQNVGGDPRIRAVNVAASDERGELVLVRPPGYSIASSLKRTTAGGDAVRIRAERLDRLCDELGLERVDVLKLDAEGAELDALRGFSRLDEVAVVIGEAHPQLLGEELDEFFGLLDGFVVRRLSESRDAVTFLALAATTPTQPQDEPCSRRSRAREA